MEENQVTQQQVQTVNITITLPVFEKLVYLVNNAGVPLNMKAIDVAEVVVFINSVNLQVAQQLATQQSQNGTEGTEAQIQPETAN
jgi:hypothetical protein